VGEVRLADTWRNGYEVHLKPGDGDLDFGAMFKLIEGKGYTGYYTNAFTSLDAMLAGRDYLVEKARAAGVRVD
jgi:sugar phosphate isomerase/epimerase